MIMRCIVHELDAQSLKTGDQCNILFESVPGKEFIGTITSIPLTPIPATLDQPSFYQIELTVPNPDLILKDGFKGEINIIPQ